MNVAAFPKSARCSACLSVVAEMQALSEASAVGMTLDLRTGVGVTKHGTVVPWSQSETRAYAVLDELCSKMRAYLLVEPPDTPGLFEFQRMGGYVDGQIIVDKLRITGKTEIGSPKASAKEHDLELFCGALIEEHEEALMRSLTTSSCAAARPRADVATAQQPKDMARVAFDAAVELAATSGASGLSHDVCVAATGWCADTEAIAKFAERQKLQNAAQPPQLQRKKTTKGDGQPGATRPKPHRQQEQHSPQQRQQQQRSGQVGDDAEL